MVNDNEQSSTSMLLDDGSNNPLSITTTSGSNHNNNSLQFIVPSDSEIFEAIGRPVPAMFLPGNCYQGMKLPGPNDWLNRYKEEGQTFYKFISSQEESPEEEPEKSIYLVPIGPFEKENAPDLNILVEYISVFFNCGHVKLLPRIELIGEDQLKVEEQSKIEKIKEHAHLQLSAKTKNSVGDAKQRKCALTYRNDHSHWNSHDHALTIQSQTTLKKESDSVAPFQRKKKRRKKEKVEKKKMYLKINDTYEAVTCRKALDHDQVQLSISDVLDVLEIQVLPDDAFCMIALTLTDLYMDEDDLFVVGWAGNYSALFSFARYDPNFTQNSTAKSTTASASNQAQHMRGDQRTDLILRRCLKTIVHETLHLFGLRHCIYYSCLMNGTASLLEDDETPMFMCPICERKLQYILKFDVVNRYRKMLDFFENYLSKHDFNEEIQWIKHRISFLESIQHDNSDASKYGDILEPMRPATSERDVFLSPMDPPLHSMNDLLLSHQQNSRSGNRNRCRCNNYLCKFSPNHSSSSDSSSEENNDSSSSCEED